ncbi:MAG: glycosyltransferase family protein [Desulfomonilaceae bacterium]
MNHHIRRILVYTHNSIGVGHAFRTSAVITGIKKWRPDIDFLVISGTSVPQVFFREGIEVIKLPSVKLDIDTKDNPLRSRYLSGFELENIFDFRQRLILASFDFLQPDALIIEHNMTGQMSELIPLLMKKWMRKGGPVDFAVAHICRGIMKWIPLLRIPYQNPRHRSESINIGSLYDFMYVLEERELIDINKEFLGDDPELEKKIHYLGKITNKTLDELPNRTRTLDRFGLQDKPLIIISLGRNCKVLELSLRLLDFIDRCNLKSKYQVVMVLDTYLDHNSSASIMSHHLAQGVRFLGFTLDLVDLFNQADLVISRAGYNTMNEILLTGVKAVIIPESHGSGEQEQRATSSQAPNILVMSEDETQETSFGDKIIKFLETGARSLPCNFDKYATGKRIITDLENWRTTPLQSC